MTVFAGTVRVLGGRVVRRLRREAQWRDPRLRFARTRLPSAEADERFPHAVASHATPLMRRLAGLDEHLQLAKVANLRIAAGALDGLVLLPGERLSFWRCVGRPDYSRGFAEGLVLDHGCLASGPGGGLCQCTNLLYWMSLHAPLTVVERWRHSYDVFPDASRTQPFGSGATCAWPALDLQVLNPGPHPMCLRLRVTGSHLEGQWRSTEPCTDRYEVYEDAHRITSEGPGTYVRCNILRRRTLDASGRQLADELVAANRALMMYEPMLPAGATAD